MSPQLSRLPALLCAIASISCIDAAAETFSLPASSANWINTAPLSLESLRGKGAVLWFFEEQ